MKRSPRNTALSHKGDKTYLFASDTSSPPDLFSPCLKEDLKKRTFIDLRKKKKETQCVTLRDLQLRLASLVKRYV